MPHIMLSTAVAAALFSAAAGARQAQDFSGTWVMDVSRSESAKHGPTGPQRKPVTLVIEQSPTQLSIERERDGESELVVYVFSKEPAGEASDIQPAAPQDPSRPVGTSGSKGAPPLNS